MTEKEVEDKCEFCGDKAVYMENIWGCLYWCADCEEDAAWQIYTDTAVRTIDY